MRIRYLLVAEAHNRAFDRTHNFLGADWKSVVVPELPAERPMVIAFAIDATDESELGQHTVRGDVEDSEGLVNFFEETMEFKQAKGPPGVPIGSVNGQWVGVIGLTVDGLHRVKLTIDDVSDEVVFVVHDRSKAAKKSPKARQSSTKSPRRSAKRRTA